MASISSLKCKYMVLTSKKVIASNDKPFTNNAVEFGSKTLIERIN